MLYVSNNAGTVLSVNNAGTVLSVNNAGTVLSVSNAVKYRKYCTSIV
jgi:hypothetical protein